MRTLSPWTWMSLLAALCGSFADAQARQPGAPSDGPACPADESPSASEAVLTTLERLESEAEAAEAAGDHLRAALLLLQAERYVPRCAAAARTDRIHRATAALRDAADQAASPSIYFELAAASVEAFLSDLRSSFGDKNPPPEVMRLRAELTLLRESAEHARNTVKPASQTSLVRPAPLPPPEPTPAERAVHIRRDRRLVTSVGLGAGITVATAVTGLLLRLQLLEGGALHRRIQAAAIASTQDSDPNNDVPHAPSNDICLSMRTEARENANVEALCDRHRNLLYASTTAFIASGAFAVATAALATTLAHHRRSPLARALHRSALSLSGGPTPGGFGIALGWRG